MNPNAPHLPPHSIEAEQSVLGGLLLDNDAWFRVGDILSDTDFYRHDHRVIFQHIVRLINSARPADVITVFEALTDAGKAEEVGSLPYLNALAQNTPSAANIRRYCEIVVEKRTRRDMLAAGSRIIELATAAGDDAEARNEEANALIMALSDSRRAGREPQMIDDILPSVIDDIEARVEKKGAISGLPTGFTDLDRMTCGLHPGDLIIVAGRPSMGKTTLATNIAENVAMGGKAALIFSLEMSGQQLAERSIARLGGVSTQAIRNGDMDDVAYDRLSVALHRLVGKKLVIDDDPSASTLAKMRIKALKLKRRLGGLDLIVIDYLQLMRGTGNTRNEEIGGITRGLKLLAKEMAVPIVLLSQLSRKTEDKADKRPHLHELRDSGSIEQDADVVLMTYRDDYYNLESPFKGFAEVLIRKQRLGPLGDVRLMFQGEFSRFCDADPCEFAQAAARAEIRPARSGRRGFDG